MHRIGIMLELTWPFSRHVNVFAGTQRYAREVGTWDCTLDEFVGGDLLDDEAGLSRYDGVIARADSLLAEQAERLGVPVVNVWFNSPVADRLPGVFPEFEEVGRVAGEHLVSRGFRRFACISTRKDQAHIAMRRGFHEVAEDCRCTYCGVRYYEEQGSWRRFQRTLDEWIDAWEPPIAVFVAFNNVTARYVANACRHRGLRIPDDVAIVTAADEPTVAILPPPSLSCVRVDYEGIGYRAARLLDDLLEGRRTEEQILFDPDGVIARASTDFFAVDDELVAAALRFVDENVCRRIHVEDVATAVKATRRTLERRFRQKTGRSVSAEIRRLRLLHAKRLLLDTDLLVKQVAQKAGFRDASRLHEVFVREIGMTPGEFRTRHG